jgi:carboxyl-terminal processing protease
MKNNRSPLFQKSFVRVSLFIVIAFLASSVFLWSYRSDDFETVKNLDVFYTLYKELNLYYVDDVDAGKIIKTGIDAMLESLDPYTVYIPESEMEDLKFMTTGQYGGIGALIRQHGDYVVIAEPYETFPAYLAGLKAGDILLEVDGKSLKGRKTSEVSELLKGQPNTSLNIKVERYGNSEPIDFEFMRQEVKVPSVPYYGMIGNGIAYIVLTRFTNGAGDEIRKAYLELKKDNQITGVIIDLRSNPGGLLMEAVNVTNIFVDKGQEVVSTRGKVSEWDKVYQAPREALDVTVPLVILVNRGSASASEIVSGAIQDLDRGVIIGQRTYGKGLVQTTRDLSYNAKLKVTTAKYYIPSGRCIQALDYSHRNEDGSVGRVPDSLVSEFSTSNGRKVFDGGGILPDIVIKPEGISNISIALSLQNIIFDYATIYASNHDSIAKPGVFKITDQEYNDFVDFASSKDFNYDTKSEEVLDELIEITKKEKYFNVVDEDIENLKEKLAHDVKKDLSVFKDEIIELLSSEIVTRYYFQKGRVEYNLAVDKEVEQAIQVISDSVMYRSILDGTYVNPDK